MVSKLDDLHSGHLVATDRLKALKVLHVIPSISKKHGGPSYAVEAIARGLQETGTEVAIATTDDDGDGARLSVLLNTAVNRDGVPHFFFRRNLRPYKVSFRLSRWLSQHVADFDVVHIHALFSFSSAVAARAARKTGIPYVVRPLGVLNRWGMENRKRLIKRTSFLLMENSILKNAAAIHYTSQNEQREAELCGADVAAVKSAIIPLPLPERATSSPSLFLDRFPAAKGKQIVLFLSRIHPKKGVELLMEAFRQVHAGHPVSVLVIAGAGEAGYTADLKRKALDMRISESMIWTGHLDGEEKWAAFDAATIYVLPSFSENFGVAAAEALVGGVPSVITEDVGLAREAAVAKAVVVTKPEPRALAAAIDGLLRSPAMRLFLQRAAREFAAKRFSPASVAAAINGLYREILDERSAVSRMKRP